MHLLKKLIFAPIFLIVFASLIYQINPLLTSYETIFSFSVATLINLIVVSVFISASCFLFCLLVTIASDWRITLPVSILCAAIPLIFIPPALALVFSVAIFISLLLINLNLDGILKGYLTFQPSSLLGPPTRHLSGFLILSFCLVYFFSANKVITQNGFQIPDTLIDTALNIAQPQLEPRVNQPQPTLSKEQIDLLKENPEVLEQFGLNPEILDTLSQPKSLQAPQNLTNDLLKQTVKDQIQNFIKPYLNFIPAFLALLLFLTLLSLASITNLLIYPTLWLTFLILEKTGFVKFEIEQRTVKKLVV